MTPTYAQQIEAYRRALLEHALAEAGGNRTQAARALGLQRTYLGRLLRDRGISYADTTPKRNGPR